MDEEWISKKPINWRPIEKEITLPLPIVEPEIPLIKEFTENNNEKVLKSLEKITVFCKSKTGIIRGGAIHCICGCQKQYNPSSFEIHSGGHGKRSWKGVRISPTHQTLDEYRNHANLLKTYPYPNLSLDTGWIHVRKDPCLLSLK